MRGLRVARGQRKGAAAAFERLAASAGMKQRLGQPGIQCNSRRSAVAVTSQELKAAIKVPGAERRREHIDIDQEWGIFSTGIQLAGIPR